MEQEDVNALLILVARLQRAIIIIERENQELKAQLERGKDG